MKPHATHISDEPQHMQHIPETFNFSEDYNLGSGE
jgi:hypothetical protein